MKIRVERLLRRMELIEMPKMEQLSQIELGLMKAISQQMIDGIAREAMRLSPEKKP